MSLVKLFFALFPVLKKGAKVTRHPSARVPRHVSSSTLSAHQMAPGSSAVLESHGERMTWYDEEREQAWCRFEDSLGRSFWRLLTTDHSKWEPPWERRP